MKKITNAAELKLAIEAKEAEQSDKLNALKSQYEFTVESLKPINLIKESVSAVASSSYQSSKVVGIISDLMMGYFTKNIFSGKINNSFKNILTTGLKMGMTKIFASNFSDAKLLSKIVFEELRRKPTPKPTNK